PSTRTYTLSLHDALPIWLKGEVGDISDPDRPKLDPKQLKVFDRLPDDQLNTRIHEFFIKPGPVELPRSPEVAREWWTGKSKEWQDRKSTRLNSSHQIISY